jgi:hypothetical protein
VFSRIFEAPASEASEPDRLIFDSIHLKAHRTTASLLERGRLAGAICRTRGGLNSRLHAVRNGQGRPVVTGANALAPLLPPAREPVADLGPDSNPFRADLAGRGITACIPPKTNRRRPIPHDKARYRIATRYERFANIALRAIIPAAIAIRWRRE